MSVTKLYHGSHCGIEGNIVATASRDICDFGMGFYAGDNMTQAKMLIANDEAGMIYTLDIDLANYKVYEFQSDIEWALYVGCHRGKISKNYKKLAEFVEKVDSNDVVIGLIADDRMAYVFEQFINGNVTDKVLTEALTHVKLGKQYVFKNDAVCSAIQIVDKENLSMDEKNELVKTKKRMIGGLVEEVNTIRLKYRRSGRFIDEILEEWSV